MVHRKKNKIVCFFSDALPIYTNRVVDNFLCFANPAEARGDRHSEAWRLRCMEAEKPGSCEKLTLVASGELPTKII